MYSSPIDQIDERIIRILAVRGRISWAELANEVHLSPTAVAERVRRLEREGVITSYSANVNTQKLGTTVRAVIEVGLVAGADIEAFERRLHTRPEISFAAYVTGRSDYSVQVDCVGAEGLDEVVRWLRSDVAVSSTESRFVLRVVIEQRQTW
jgi:Lrp/AsnC family leucine-responsive transcriptional regulator